MQPIKALNDGRISAGRADSVDSLARMTPVVMKLIEEAVQGCGYEFSQKFSIKFILDEFD